MSKKVHYTGETAVEIGVGNFKASFEPDEVKEIKDPFFRLALLDRDDIEPVEGDDDEDGDELTRTKLMRMRKDDLLTLATERGVEDVTEDNNRDEIADKILAHNEGGTE